jgi:uncharacterized membrane protein
VCSSDLFLEQIGVLVEPLQLSLWALPTAFAALLIHCTRLALFQRRLERALAVSATADRSPNQR